MNELTIDPAMTQQLTAFEGSVRLRDASGMTVGHFLHPEEYEDYIDRKIAEGTPFTPAEIREMRAQRTGRPLAEIWKDLGRS